MQYHICAMTIGKAYREYNTTLPPGIFFTFGLPWTLVQKPRPEATYIESSFNTREGKDQRPNLETSIKLWLKSKSSPVTTSYCLNGASCKNRIIFLWIARAMTDQSTIQWLTNVLPWSQLQISVPQANFSQPYTLWMLANNQLITSDPIQIFRTNGLDHEPKTWNQKPTTKKASVPRRLHIDMRPAILQHHQAHRFCGAMKQDPCRPLCGFWPLVVALLLPSLPVRSFQAFAANLMRSPPWTPSFANSGIFCCMNPQCSPWVSLAPFPFLFPGMGLDLVSWYNPFIFRKTASFWGLFGDSALGVSSCSCTFGLGLGLGFAVGLDLGIGLGLSCCRFLGELLQPLEGLQNLGLKNLGRRPRDLWPRGRRPRCRDRIT